ncbi:MAG TPA: hypothetical protein VGY58_17065, partial [Gemmataceae bacterium]|nr:hypothetical protein [Gemmataceae bacterium]
MLRAVERPFAALARRPGLAVLVCGCISFTTNAAVSLLGGIPPPRVHDEFSYLLQADTFAHGRLTNPTHPLWVHFESMHIIHQPTYASKYPPAQGLMLALGQIMTGEPIVGAWLSGALASAAICWLLLGYLRPRWAVLGGILAALHPLLLAWSQSYWGGAVAACGGALLLGAARRLRLNAQPRNALLLAIGLAILANSRPFEGLVFALLVLVPLVLHRKNGDWLSSSSCLSPFLQQALKTSLIKILVPACAILIPTAVWMGYYNWRVTGDVLNLPYQVHASAYAVAPPLLWQAARPEPVYRHKELRDLYVGWELPPYVEQRTPYGFVAGALRKFQTLVHTYFPILAFQIPLLALPWMLNHRRTRLALMLAALFFLALCGETWLQPHYAAPILGLLVLLSVQGLRAVRVWRWRGRHAGAVLVRSSLLVHAALLASFCVTLSQQAGGGWAQDRARIVRELAQQPGRHLVIVRYGPHHVPHDEWVYN